MHHTLDRGRGIPVRRRSEVDAEIARENHAISYIESAIGEDGVLFLRTCAYCAAIAVTDCAACDTNLCEDDAVWIGAASFCPECLGLRP